MLTIQRNNTDEKRKKAYSANRPTQEFRTLDEDYQDTLERNQAKREDDLWGRLNQTSDATDSMRYETPQRDYSREYDRERDYTRNYSRERDYAGYENHQTSGYIREENVKDLPLYNTEASTSSMAMKKYSIKSEKKKSNVVGKIILACYIVVVALVATLVIVDSTIKTSAATSTVVENESTIPYIQQETNESTNWFDTLCDWFSRVAGD